MKFVEMTMTPRSGKGRNVKIQVNIEHIVMVSERMEGRDDDGASVIIKGLGSMFHTVETYAAICKRIDRAIATK